MFLSTVCMVKNVDKLTAYFFDLNAFFCLLAKTTRNNNFLRYGFCLLQVDLVFLTVERKKYG